jgi:hypothetical protein
MPTGSLGVQLLEALASAQSPIGGAPAPAAAPEQQRQLLPGQHPDQQRPGALPAAQQLGALEAAHAARRRGDGGGDASPARLEERMARYKEVRGPRAWRFPLAPVARV